MKNLVLPLILGCGWVAITYIANKKNGDYGAPLGLLWSQEVEKNNSKLINLLEEHETLMPNEILIGNLDDELDCLLTKDEEVIIDQASYYKNEMKIMSGLDNSDPSTKYSQL